MKRVLPLLSLGAQRVVFLINSDKAASNVKVVCHVAATITTKPKHHCLFSNCYMHMMFNAATKSIEALDLQTPVVASTFCISVLSSYSVFLSANLYVCGAQCESVFLYCHRSIAFVTKSFVCVATQVFCASNVFRRSSTLKVVRRRVWELIEERLVVRFCPPDREQMKTNALFCESFLASDNISSERTSVGCVQI